MDTSDCILQLDRLAVGYREKVLIGEISFSVSRGEMVTLIGPNGSGKSTILKTVAGLLKALEGRIVLLGRGAEEIPASEAAKLLASVWTEKPRTEYMTCLDVAAGGRYPYTGKTGVLTEEDYAVAERALAAVRMEECSLRDFNELSDGQKQRVMLAGGLCQEPELLILDEPTSYLDITHKLEVLDMLSERVKTGKTAVLMSLHEIDLAMRYSDRIICVKGDRIGYSGTPKELMEQDVLTDLYGLDQAEASYARELALTGMRSRA